MKYNKEKCENCPHNNNCLLQDNDNVQNCCIQE